jgi:hypothetical protein
MTTMIRRLLLSLLLALPLSLPAAVRAADPPEPLPLQIQRLQERLDAPGTGLLMRYSDGVDRLAETLDKGEIRRFPNFVREEILTPWRQIPSTRILEIALHPPGTLTPDDQQLIRANALRLRQIQLQLRKARRVLASIEKSAETSRRDAQEIARITQRYEQTLTELEREDPELAHGHRAWFNDEFQPSWQSLRARGERTASQAAVLLRWTEAPELHDMLGDLREVNQAMEQIGQHYQMSGLQTGHKP